MKKIVLLSCLFFASLSMAVGQKSTCVYCSDPPTGESATNIGDGSNASGIHSVSIGANSHAAGMGSISIGTFSKTLFASDNGIAIGTRVEAANGLSMVIGTGPASGALTNTIQNSLMVGFDAIYPTLFIEAPENQNYQGTKTGRIGIGNITDPSAKLHIKADYDEPAVMFIEPNTWQVGSTASIALGSTSYGITSDFETGLTFKSSSSFRFLNGRMGIGAFNNILPEAKLHIKSSQFESADLFIEPYIDQIEGSWQASLYLGTKEHIVSAISEYGLVYSTSMYHVFQGGNVGIGTFEPEAKLHIKSSQFESADLFIEPYIDHIEGSWQASLYLGTKENILSGNSEYGLVYSTTLNHLFQGGNVGIGTLEPTALFHVDDNGGSLKYENANISIYGRQSHASMSFNNADGYNWNITNHSNHKTLYFSYGLSGKLGISDEDGVFVNERVIVCDMSEVPLSQIPNAGIQVIQNDDLDKKAAEYITDDGHKIFFVPRLSNSGYSPMSTTKDAGIFWSDGLYNVNQNQEGGLVIAAHRDGAYNGLKIDGNGNVGIGIGEPTARLDVKDRIQISGSDPTGVSFQIVNAEHGVSFVIAPNGRTYISNKLWAEEIEVLANVDWPDFVFSDSYKLRSLKEVEGFIKENNHLPDVPSQEDVTENGINLGEMDALLLQKIEELTLYVIEQDKKIEDLNERIEDLSSDR